VSQTIEEIKQRLNSGTALIQHLSERFSCFPVLPGSAETQVVWGK